MHLVINVRSADHSLVTQVHQLEVGEKSSAPGTDTTGVFLAAAEGRLTAASFSLIADPAWGAEVEP